MHIAAGDVRRSYRPAVGCRDAEGETMRLRKLLASVVLSGAMVVSIGGVSPVQAHGDIPCWSLADVGGGLICDVDGVLYYLP